MPRFTRRTVGVTLALLAAAGTGIGLARVTGAPDRVLATATVALPNGGQGTLVLSASHIVSTHPRRATLVLVDANGHRRRLSPEAHYNFWDLSVGDVDGDGRQEIGLCTFSRTARDPSYARRYFVYAWDETGDLMPIWRGSRLCRPYVSARLCDINRDGRAELVSVERGLGGGLMLVAYEWNQFGFWGLGHSEEVEDLSFLGPARDAGGALVWVARAGARPGIEHWVLRGGVWVPHENRKG